MKPKPRSLRGFFFEKSLNAPAVFPATEVSLLPRRIMSNPNQFFQDLSFDPEQVTAVNKAYDLAVKHFRISVSRKWTAKSSPQEFFRPRRAANGTPANFASAPSMD